MPQPGVAGARRSPETDEESSVTQPEPTQPLQLAFTLPTAPDTRVNLQLTLQPYSVVVYIACTAPDGSSSAATLGSFVYALPNLANPKAQPISTALYSRTTSVDFMTRLARILAAKLQKPVFVGGDVKFWTPEDEGLAMKGVVATVARAVAHG